MGLIVITKSPSFYPQTTLPASPSEDWDRGRSHSSPRSFRASPSFRSSTPVRLRSSSKVRTEIRSGIGRSTSADPESWTGGPDRGQLREWTQPDMEFTFKKYNKTFTFFIGWKLLKWVCGCVCVWCVWTRERDTERKREWDRQITC